ncbi:hypothetical protein C4K04_2723 [Pseudomonas chlororaphis]|uniref:Uncharacterized protein n=1 Tax=Pseudomonas chlororaphis TaxID=587753 RepID=A0A3G7TMQ7_9PSED|nr:hypothetical protein [Pseudomonas chlororaphis]AZE48395.1 hypothetical protein C4K04_2723 [Pseudomonas chlororaphis]
MHHSSLSQVQAKEEILDCLNNACHVIHDTPNIASFLSWWEKHGSDDHGLTADQFQEVYEQLRADIYTFDGCIAQYRRLLQERPRQALLIGEGEYAYLQPDGELIGLTMHRSSTIDQADAYDLDSSAFNNCTGGWMDETYVETRQRIAAPVFVPVTATFQ